MLDIFEFLAELLKQVLLHLELLIELIKLALDISVGQGRSVVHNLSDSVLVFNLIRLINSLSRSY